MHLINILECLRITISADKLLKHLKFIYDSSYQWIQKASNKYYFIPIIGILSTHLLQTGSC